MKNTGINFKKVGMFIVVAGVVTGGIVPMPLMARENTIKITDSDFTSTKLVKGDVFTIDFEFIAQGDTVSVTDVKVSGTAVEDETMSYQLVNPVSGEEKEGNIGLGELVHLEIRGLQYTGEGKDVTVTIETENGSVQETISLNAATTEELKGALILDPEVDSNISVSMAAGESKNMSLTLKNIAEADLEDSIVKLSFIDTVVGLTVLEGQYIEVDTIGAGKSEEINFVIDATETVKAGTYALQADINGMNQTIYIEIENSDLPPSIHINFDKNQVFETGTTTPLKLTVNNSGNEVAQNVKLSFQANEGIGLAGSSSVTTIGNIEAGASKIVELDLLVDESITSTLTQVDFEVTYTTKQGDAIEEVQSIYLTTSSEDEVDAQVTLRNIQGPTGTLLAHQSFQVVFEVISDADAEDVKVNVNTPEGIVATSQNVFMIQDLKANTPQTITVDMLVTDDVETSYYPIELAVEYTYNDEIQQEMQYSGVSVFHEVEEEEEDEEEATEQPKVIVGNYKLSPENLQPGQVGELQITLYNTHGTETVSNLTATYTIDGTSQIITPIASGNTLFTSQIAPGGTSGQVLTFKVSPDAEDQDYALNIALDYENEDGEQITAEQVLLLAIQEEGMIEVGELGNIQMTQNRATPLTIPLYNRGKSALQNVMISLEGEGFTVDDNQLYLNSFGVGSTEYYLPSITPTQNDVEVILVAEYENSEGVLERFTYPLEIEMASQSGSGLSGETNDRAAQMDAMMSERNASGGGKSTTSGQTPSQMTGQDAEAGSTWLVPTLAGIGVVGSFLLYKVLRKKKALEGVDSNESL